MRLSRTAQSSIVLALTALCLSTEAVSRRRITVKTYKTNYRIDSWDDGREDPYRVTYWKYGLKSVYTFDVSGHVKTLTTRDTMYAFDLDVSSRMLITSSDKAVEDVDIDPSAVIACTTCEVTWRTLCDVGLPEVCFLDENNPVDFDEDAEDSVRRFCSAVRAACETSAFDVCNGQCVEETTREPVDPPTFDPTSSPTPEITTAPTPEPTPTPTTEPDSPPTPDSTEAPIPQSTPAPTPVSSQSPTLEYTLAPAPESTPPPIPEPTTAPTLASDPLPPTEPTPAPTPEAIDACNPTPCQNGGSCSVDPAGGHLCACASGYGGMSCQIETSSLDPFYIEVDFNGTWTDARRAVVLSAADRWSEIITHVPCGGSAENPAGRLLITATLGEIDGSGDGARNVLGSARPTSIWAGCRSISLLGEMTFDIFDIADLESQGTFEGLILHEMGHVIGIGTLWGAGFGECSTCLTNQSPAWTCPAAVSAYADIGGSGADIVESDGVAGTICAHLDEDIFDDELLTGSLDDPMFLSKMTAATLEDIDYIIDPSAVDAYILPSERGGSIERGSGLSTPIIDTAVETMILVVENDGNIVEETVGVMIMF